MRILVTGATGNVGTRVMDALGRDPAVDSLVGLARRAPRTPPPRGEFITADIASA